MLAVPVIAGLGAAVLATSFLSGIVGMAGGMILMGILLAPGRAKTTGRARGRTGSSWRISSPRDSAD